MARIWFAAVLVSMAWQAQAADGLAYGFLNGDLESPPASTTPKLVNPLNKWSKSASVMPGSSLAGASSSFPGIGEAGMPHDSGVSVSPYGTSSGFSKGY